MPPDAYGREIHVLVAGRDIASPPLSVDFRVNFDDEPEPNDATITLFNLSDDTVNRLVAGLPLTLNAGYQGDVGTLFAGRIKDVRGRWEGATRLTELTVVDSADEWAALTVTRSFAPGTRASQIIRELMRGSGLETGALQLPVDTIYHRGMAVSGSLQSAVSVVAADAGADLHVAGGTLYVWPRGSGIQTGVLLRANTGLIDTPQRVDREDENVAWSVWSLLNHRLRTGSLIRVESRAITGAFRIKSGQHTANDADFMTRLEVVAL